MSYAQTTTLMKLVEASDSPLILMPSNTNVVVANLITNLDDGCTLVEEFTCLKIQLSPHIPVLRCDLS